MLGWGQQEDSRCGGGQLLEIEGKDICQDCNTKEYSPKQIDKGRVPNFVVVAKVWSLTIEGGGSPETITLLLIKFFLQICCVSSNVPNS